jgi:hypothetical protein
MERRPDERGRDPDFRERPEIADRRDSAADCDLDARRTSEQRGDEGQCADAHSCSDARPIEDQNAFDSERESQVAQRQRIVRVPGCRGRTDQSPVFEIEPEDDRPRRALSENRHEGDRTVERFGRGDHRANSRREQRVDRFRIAQSEVDPELQARAGGLCQERKIGRTTADRVEVSHVEFREFEALANRQGERDRIIPLIKDAPDATVDVSPAAARVNSAAGADVENGKDADDRGS